MISSHSQVTRSVFAGWSGTGSTDGIGTSAYFNYPEGIAVDSQSNLYIADTNNHRIRKITPQAIVTTIAGSSQGYADGIGSAAMFNHPQGLTVDNLGNIFVADTWNMRIRKITPNGTVTTVAGSGIVGGANSIPLLSQFDNPAGIMIKDGILYVSDNNCLIRTINLSPGVGYVSTFAGTTCGFADGTITNAKFGSMEGMVVDGQGNIIIADTGNHRIRKIQPNGTVITIAGSGVQGFTNAGINLATFNNPSGVAVDNSGNVYVADKLNNYVRKISAGLVTSLIHGGQYCNGIINDNNGNLFTVSQFGQSIYKISGAILGIEENNISSNLKVYPNPAKDNIIIDFGAQANVLGYTIKITNTLGQEIFNQPVNAQQFNIPLNSWNGQGMCFVNLIDAQGHTIDVKKIILQ